jgi:hypothetical protein
MWVSVCVPQAQHAHLFLGKRVDSLHVIELAAGKHNLRDNVSTRTPTHTHRLLSSVAVVRDGVAERDEQRARARRLACFL